MRDTFLRRLHVAFVVAWVVLVTACAVLIWGGDVGVVCAVCIWIAFLGFAFAVVGVGILLWM